MTEKPLYLEIADYWRQKIFTESLRPGEELPSRLELKEKHGTTRATVDKAMSILKAEGLIVSSRGEPTTVVNRPRVGKPTGASRVRRIEMGGKDYSNGETSRDHVAMMRACADPGIARDLDIDLHDEVVVRRRTFVQDGKPSVVATSVVHARALAVVPELTQQGKLPVWWRTLYVQRTGKTVVGSPELQGARLLSSEEAALLDIELAPGESLPVLVLHTLFHDEDGPLEFWEDVYAPGLWHESV